jgi:hypothetical protein
MQYLEELKRQNKRDYWGAMPLVAVGLFMTAVIAFITLMPLAFASLFESKELASLIAQMALQLLACAGGTAAYAGLCYLLVSQIAAAERRHVKRELVRSGLLRRFVLHDSSLSPWPMTAGGCWSVDFSQSGLWRAKRPPPGSLAEKLCMLVSHFDAWCRADKLKPHPRSLDIAMYLTVALTALTVIAFLCYRFSLDLQHQQHASPSWIEITLILAFYYGCQVILCTFPAGRRIGIRQALADYFTQEDPAALV